MDLNHMESSMHATALPRVQDAKLLERLERAEASETHGTEVGRATDEPKRWAVRLDNRSRGQQRLSDAFSALMIDLGMPAFSTAHSLAGRCKYKFVALMDDGVYLFALVPPMTRNAH